MRRLPSVRVARRSHVHRRLPRRSPVRVTAGADWNLLRYLHHTGGASVTEIARLFDVTKQAASQHVASFVGRGYGTRTRPGDDGRVRVVELTDRGRAARRAAIEIADRIEAELVARLGRDALEAWRSVTDALIEIYLHEAPEMVRMAAEMSSARD